MDNLIELKNFHPVSAIYVFADIRGFSSWARDNQTELKKLLKITYSLAIQVFGEKTNVRYMKRIVKFTGDGFFAVNEYNDSSLHNIDFRDKLIDIILSMNNYVHYFNFLVGNSNLHDRGNLGIGFGVTYGFSNRFNLPGYPIDYTGHKINYCSRLCSLSISSEMVFEQDLEDIVTETVTNQSPNTKIIKETANIRGMHNPGQTCHHSA